jgi:predicted Zn-dependent protease
MIIRTIHSVIIIVFFCFSIVSFGQEIDEGLTLLKDSDDTRIKFENHFYDALKYKAIGNYSRAIIELEKCQQLFPKEYSLAFEFAKNYYFQNKFDEAALYIEEALHNDPESYWYLEQAKKIYVKQFKYSKAIEVQEDIIKLRPEKREDLVLIYIRANEIARAQTLIDELTRQGISSYRLKSYQRSIVSLRKRSAPQEIVAVENETIQDLKVRFKSEKKFDVLKEILVFEYANRNEEALLKFSKEGLELFPAQPFVYLMQGRSFNFGKKYNDAIDVLINGIDFILEDKLLEAYFYEQLAISYEGLNQVEKARKSTEKSVELRKN